MVACVHAGAQFIPSPDENDPRRVQPMPMPGHPLIVHWEDYPSESVRLDEQGQCQVAILVDLDGRVLASQLRMSTGYPRLDAACLLALRDGRALPATQDGKAVVGWGDFRMTWGSSGAKRPLHPTDSMPAIQKDVDLPVGPRFYPELARARKEHGMCMVMAVASAEGKFQYSKLLRSSKSESLDAACTAAFDNARFTPALKDGKPVPGAGVFAIFWNLK